MSLDKFGDNIWILEGDRVKMLSIPFSTRMTIARLSNGSLWLHSPIAIAPERVEQINHLGKVEHIVAPNLLHHLFVGDWSQEYPHAKLWAAPGLETRRKDLNFEGVLQDRSEPDWESDIEQFIFRGSKVLPEVVFFHKFSKTLILTDLIQNHDPDRENWFWTFIKRVNGVLAPHGGVPKDLKLTIRDREKAKASARRMLAWDFNKIIISHGICIENNAKDWILRAFSWVL